MSFKGGIEVFIYLYLMMIYYLINFFCRQEKVVKVELKRVEVLMKKLVVQ